jgi:hypothetical protein
LRSDSNWPEPFLLEKEVILQGSRAKELSVVLKTHNGEIYIDSSFNGRMLAIGEAGGRKKRLADREFLMSEPEN